MRRITSKEHLHSLLEDRPENTQTWLVDASVGDVPFPEPGPGMRQMSSDEVREMAKYLDVDEGQLPGPFYVGKSLVCPHCGRASTFLDFIKTAVDAELHEKSRLRDVLLGRVGRWITIVGKTAERTLVCVGCNVARRMPIRRPGGDCDYEGQHYRYG